MTGAGERLTRLVLVGLGLMVCTVAFGWAGLTALRWSEDGDREALASRAVADARAAASADRADRERREVARQQHQQAMASEAWRSLDRAPCQTPTTPTACGDVEAFITTYPSSSHVDEARALVVAAQPTLDGFRDDAAWSVLNLARCKTPRRSDDCDGVRRYVDRYSNGHHADDARKLLASTAAARMALERQESLRAAAELKADAAQYDAEAKRKAAEVKRREAEDSAERAAMADAMDRFYGAGKYYKGNPRWVHRGSR